jgi:spermidine/putrescine transport system substrate-binding protein
VHGYSNDIFQANLVQAAAAVPHLQGMPKEARCSPSTTWSFTRTRRGRSGAQIHELHARGEDSAELTNLIGSGNPNLDAVNTSSPRS